MAEEAITAAGEMVPGFTAAFRSEAKAMSEGGSVAGVLAAMGARGYGPVLLVLGVFLLPPLAWGPAQIVGLLLLVEGGRMLGAAGAWTPFAGKHLSNESLLAAGDAVGRRFGWLEGLAPPFMADVSIEFAAAGALIMAGLCALAPTGHMLLSLGVIALGLGLAQRNGALALAGVAVCVAQGAFLLTMLAGAFAGGEFADGWVHNHMPWLVDFARHIAPRPDIPPTAP